MESITWAWLVGTILSGIVGNRADAEVVRVYTAGWQQVLHRLNSSDLRTTQNQLATAVNRAFLWAQQSLVQECLDEFTGGTYGGMGSCTAMPGHETEVPLLIAKDRQLKTELKALEKGKIETLTTADTTRLKNLLQSQDVASEFNNQLTAIIAQDTLPESYRARAVIAETGLMARLAAFFEFELETNQAVQNWFQTELLLRINEQLQNCEPLKLNEFVLELHRFSKQLPELQNRLNNLVLAVREQGQTLSEVRALVTSRTNQLIILSERHADDLIALKQSVDKVLEEIREKTISQAPDLVVVEKTREGPNPFIYGPAVPPDRFFGRQRAKTDIKNRIGGVEPQSINIVGLRRNGKSSILRYVKERISEFCTPEQKPLVVLLDLQDRRFHTPDGILEGLRRGIEKQTGKKPWPREANDDPFELEDGLEAICEQGYRLIVVFDEFGAIGKRLEIFQDWGDDWRAKASAGRVTLVIASRRPLSEVYNTIGLTSPFGNIFSTTLLGLLDLEPWQHFLEQSGLSNKEIAWVEKTAGRLPYFTQLAAAMIWQHRSLDLAKAEFQKEAEPRFRELWSELTSSEKLTLQQLTKDNMSPPSRTLVKTLKLYGLLSSDTQIYSSGFLDFVSKQR